MTPGAVPLVVVTSRLAEILLLIGVALAMFRLVRGPDAADRIVALDLISILVVAFLAVEAIRSGRISLLDVAIGFALVAFLGTVALSRFLERRTAQNGAAPPLTPEEKADCHD